MVTVVQDAEGITVKDDEGKELEGYFCPFAGEICYEGEVISEKISSSSSLIKGKCRFWSTGQAQRCWLLPALGGLATLNQIASDLHTLAAKD